MLRENKWFILAIVSCALFLIAVDMTVLYTALPTLTHDLKATAAEKLWIINAYTLVVAGLLPGFGTLGDRVGHKRMMIGMLLFGAASLGAALAPSAQRLILARIILGLGAAMMMPATLSIIRLTFDDLSERTLALGIWSAIASGGAALGPVIGGLMLEYFRWGAVFLINVPIVPAALICAGLILPKNAPNADQKWSLGGSLLITVGLVGLTYAIKELSKAEPSLTSVAATLAIGAAALTGFIQTQRRSRNPLIDFSLFQDRTFTNGVLVALLCSVAMVGTELAISQRLQLVVGLTPLKAGLAILPIPLAAFLGGPLAGLALPRLGLVLLARESGGLIPGAGMAASIEEVSYELGGVMGVTIFGSILTAAYSASLVLPQEFASLGQVYDSLDAAILASERLTPEAAGTLVELARKSFGKGFIAVLSLAGLMMTAMLALIGLQKGENHSLTYNSMK